ncbi:hypothetical protein [Pectobacterium polaris]|uniref:hypothetical protein n=1 Tax=Pectobacterium polaris TaxID=2042057 RepID=UPI003F5C04C9
MQRNPGLQPLPPVVNVTGEAAPVVFWQPAMNSYWKNTARWYPFILRLVATNAEQKIFTGDLMTPWRDHVDSLDDKRNPIQDNNLPHLLASWKHYRTLRGLQVDNFMGEKLS